jgi:anti-sigma B factor antagonist
MLNLTTDNIAGDILIIHVGGEVDASSSIELDNTLAEAMNSGAKKVLVNCEHLQYISSAGLGVFMSYIEESKQKHIRMVLYGLSEKVLGIFKLLGLHNVLSITQTEEEAKNYGNGA